MLDLFAYNEDSFQLWVTELENMASHNASVGGYGKFKNSSVYSRPSSSLSVGSSRAAVAPASASHDNHLTEASPEHSSRATSGSASGGVDYSIFTAPTSPVSPVADDEGGGGSRQIAKPSSQGKPAAVKNAALSVSKRVQVVPASTQASAAKSARSTVVENFIGESFRSPDLVNQSDHANHATYSDADII